MNLKENKELEKLEQKYLTKFYYFLKYSETELLSGFKTKEKIKDDWIGYYNSNISNFAVGAERIVYSLLNGKQFGIPNSAPVGSDLMFEVEEAFIHIDLKTVGATSDPNTTFSTNIDDFCENIFIGNNQTSYKGKFTVNARGRGPEEREYKPNLPCYYNATNSNCKPCLTYIISILYDKDNLSILVINIMSVPNGQLYEYYKGRPLNAGKNTDKVRFNFKEVNSFELLENKPSRIYISYFNENIPENIKEKLNFLNKVYSNNRIT